MSVIYLVLVSWRNTEALEMGEGKEERIRRRGEPTTDLWVTTGGVGVVAYHTHTCMSS